MPNFCMGCIHQYKDTHNICPQCGYIEDPKTANPLHMEPSSILRDRYIVGRALGFGGFGVTYIGWDAVLEQKVAIKEYFPSEYSTRIPGQTHITVFSGDKAEQFKDGLAKFVEEAQRLVKFHQEDGVVRIFDGFEANNTAYIIMELLQGETLAEYLKREKTMPAEKAIALLMPVIHSLESINKQGVIHRDIAPDNIILTDEGKVKLIDFGSARYAAAARNQGLTVIIKPGYSPEEQYRSLSDQGSHTDVYAIGATLYRMITGQTPPDAFERRAYFENKKKDILKPVSRLASEVTDNQDTAIHNALGIRIEDRTPDMATLAKELTTAEPEKVKRLHGKIKRRLLYAWPLWAKIVVPIAMVAIVVLSTLFALGLIGFDAGLQTAIYMPDSMTRVPSVINDDIAQAEDRLSTANLLHTITGRSYSNEITPGLVLTQNINAGSVVIVNTIVGVTINAGVEADPQPDVMPDLRFRARDEAIQLLEGMGLNINVEYTYSETIAAGLVISQSPAMGTVVAYGDTASIVVSIGSQPFAMLDVVGAAGYSAMRDLIYAKLAVSVEYENNDAVAEGNIVRQSVAAGTDVYRGDVIIITVASQQELVRVADVVGLSEIDAVDVLTGQGFVVEVNLADSDVVELGDVVWQYPIGGSLQVEGRIVVITISSGRDIPPTPPIQEEEYNFNDDEHEDVLTSDTTNENGDAEFPAEIAVLLNEIWEANMAGDGLRVLRLMTQDNFFDFFIDRELVEYRIRTGEDSVYSTYFRYGYMGINIHLFSANSEISIMFSRGDYRDFSSAHQMFPNADLGTPWHIVGGAWRQNFTGRVDFYEGFEHYMGYSISPDGNVTMSQRRQGEALQVWRNETQEWVFIEY